MHPEELIFTQSQKSAITPLAESKPGSKCRGGKQGLWVPVCAFQAPAGVQLLLVTIFLFFFPSFVEMQLTYSIVDILGVPGVDLIHVYIAN